MTTHTDEPGEGGLTAHELELISLRGEVAALGAELQLARSMAQSVAKHAEATEAELAQCRRERDEAREELARVQRLPELPWAQVCASLMQRFSAMARAGYQQDAKKLLAVLDKGKTFVTRIEAERDAARAQVAALLDSMEIAATLAQRNAGCAPDGRPSRERRHARRLER